MLNPSTLSVSAAANRALQAVGETTAASEWLDRGTWAIQAALKHWDNQGLWDWRAFTYTVETPPATASASTGWGHVSISGIAPKAIYNVRYLSPGLTAARTMKYLSKRRLDRADPLNMSTVDVVNAAWTGAAFSATSGEPYFWTFYWGNALNSIVLLSQPSATGGATEISYYDHITSSATGTATLGVPAQFEDYIIAQAAYRLLLDKGDRPDRINEYKQYWVNGLEQAKIDHSVQPDEDYVILPQSEDQRLIMDPLSPNDYMYGY